FFQAEDGIRDRNVTGVQTCALPICASYGITGQDAPTSGLAVQRYAPQGNFYYNGSYIQSYSPVSNPNPDLKWEEKKEFNVGVDLDRKSTRLNSSHVSISYAVFCLKK